MEEQYYPTEERESVPIYFDTQISQELIKVRSKISKVIEIRPVRDKQGKIIRYEIHELPTRYREILTEDVSTAFLDENSLSVLRDLQFLLGYLKSIGESRNWDLSDAYNFIADYHNAMVVSSKATGEGAKIAKSQFVHRKSESLFSQAQEKRKKLFGLLPF